MAAVDFPASPSVGQIFTPGGGLPQYVWTGTVWNSYGTSQPKTWMSLAASPPASPVDGDFWWQTDTGLLYVRYNDGSSVQWVVATPAMDLAALDTRYKQITDGGVFKISSGGPTVANQATQDITLPTGYTAFELLLASVTTTGAGSFYVSASVDGTTFPGSGFVYLWNATVQGAPPTNQPNFSATDGGWLIGNPLSSAINRMAARMTIPVVTDASQVQHVLYQSSYFAAGNLYVSLVGEGVCPAAGPLAKLRLFFGGGNQIAAGLRWQLNGMK